MSDEELMQAVEQQCGRLFDRGLIAHAAEGHGLLRNFRNAFEDYRVSRARSARHPVACGTDDVSTILDTTVLREWRLVLLKWLDGIGKVEPAGA